MSKVRLRTGQCAGGKRNHPENQAQDMAVLADNWMVHRAALVDLSDPAEADI